MVDKHPFSDGVTNISPWHPETDPVKQAALGKLAEELAEANARVARCIIQGIDERDPDTKRTNRNELAREMVDVWAAFDVLTDGNVADDIEINYERMANKAKGFRNWFKMIRSAGIARKAGE